MLINACTMYCMMMPSDSISNIYLIFVAMVAQLAWFHRPVFQVSLTPPLLCTMDKKQV